MLNALAIALQARVQAARAHAVAGTLETAERLYQCDRLVRRLRGFGASEKNRHGQCK